MRIILTTIVALLCLPMTITHCSAEVALGGLHTNDNVATVFKTMNVPEMIQARRRNGPDTDQAILMYQRQGASVYIGLTPYGDRLEHMLTESTAITTNDGIKVGDPRSTMVTKRGEPEEITTDQPGVAECWYWSQGINFAVNEETGKILNIFIFPPVERDSGAERITVPEGTLQISHEYKDADRQGTIVGRVSNKSVQPQYDVRIGITLYDKDRRVVDVQVAEIGSLMPGAAFPFKADVERKGGWTDYSVDCLAHSADSGRARLLIKAGKMSLGGKKTIVLPVADQSKPK